MNIYLTCLSVIYSLHFSLFIIKNVKEEKQFSIYKSFKTSVFSICKEEFVEFDTFLQFYFENFKTIHIKMYKKQQKI